MFAVEVMQYFFIIDISSDNLDLGVPQQKKQAARLYVGEDGNEYDAASIIYSIFYLY